LIAYDDLISTFIVLWSVIDPIGTVPVFLAVTKGYDDNKKKKIAKLASYVSFGVLVFFLIVGEIVLKSIGVPLAAFQTSGGIILFLFALNMIFGNSKPEEEIQLIKDDDDAEETAIFPLAIPSIASPGAILAIVLLTDNTRHSMLNQAMTAGVMGLILIINYFLMILSNKIHRRIGNSGAIVISKVMGLILASMAANNILMGIKEFFKL
jgi:multiple antibiotic resistance protein